MSACVLDTDVVIAALDRRDRRHARAAKALEAMIEEDVNLLLSLVSYAEVIVKPAQSETTLRTARDALRALGVRLVAPTSSIARDAARHRGRDVDLAGGFAIATARAHDATIASFDPRVRRALPGTGVELAPVIG